MILDIEAIKGRIARAGKFSIPRWIAADLNALIEEVMRLRENAPPAEYEKELRKMQSRIWVLERDLARQKETHDAEVARLREIAETERSNAAQMEYEAEAERLSIVEYLRNFSTDIPPGPVSPVRKAAQAFAARASDVIERGEHRSAQRATAA
jgi:hypothetical protein